MQTFTSKSEMIVNGSDEVEEISLHMNSLYHQIEDEQRVELDLINHSIDMVPLSNEFNYGSKMELLVRLGQKKMSKHY